MTTVFLVMSNQQIPVIAFSTLSEAQEFCSSRPDLSYLEFTVPATDAGSEEIKENLRDFLALKHPEKATRGMRISATAIDANEAEVDILLDQRLSIHQEMLEKIRVMTQEKNPDRDPKAVISLP